VDVINRTKNDKIFDKCFGVLSYVSNYNDFIRFFMEQETISLLLYYAENFKGKSDENEHRQGIIVAILSNLCSGPDETHTEVIIV